MIANAFAMTLVIVACGAAMSLVLMIAHAVGGDDAVSLTIIAYCAFAFGASSKKGN